MPTQYQIEKFIGLTTTDIEYINSHPEQLECRQLADLIIMQCLQPDDDRIPIMTRLLGEIRESFNRSNS